MSMPEPKANTIFWIELGVKDRHQAAKFYSDLFGWETYQHDDMNYSTFATANGPTGGFNPSGNQGVEPGGVLLYVRTDDVDGMVEKATSLGGSVLQPKMHIPNVGWFAIIGDTVGNRVAVMTPEPPQQPTS